MDLRVIVSAACAAATLIGSIGACAADGTLHVTSRETPPPNVADLARPAAAAFEQRLREHAVAPADMWLGPTLHVGTFDVVEYRNRNILDGGSSWCWVDFPHDRAGCAEWGGRVLVDVVRMLAPATPADADFGLLVSTLVGARTETAHVDRRRDGVHVDYTFDRFDEARGKKSRVHETVWITRDRDVLVAEDHDNTGDVPAGQVLSFEGDRVGKGSVKAAMLAPLEARRADFSHCFADERDSYPIVSLDITLDAHDRVDKLAAWGTRVSLDTTACVAALVRSTQFDHKAERDARLSINRHAP